LFYMSRWRGAGLFVLLAAAFLIVNRGAYKGYFQDDEIDNISWTRLLSPQDFAQALITPRLADNNFRPVGHFYFREAAGFFGLDFPKYVFVIQLVHLLNVWLLWLLARRVGAKPWAAAAACCFFAFHMALFDAVWKPMYIFDLLCATFCLASILLYAQRRWLLSLFALWLAYKAKELAIMLPLVLACYELWFGNRRWKVLVPFFVVSLSFGLQGLLRNPNQNDEYQFRFGPSVWARTSSYYASRILLTPYLGFLLPAVALGIGRNRRTWFGLAAMALFFFPLLFLPGRLFSAYCYLPFTGLALALAGLADALHPSIVAVFFLLWLPVDYASLRAERRATLAQDDEARAWMTAFAQYAAAGPRPDVFVYSGAPEGFASWGVAGAIRYWFPIPNPEVHAIEEPAASQAFQHSRVALLAWDQERHRLEIVPHTPQSRDASFVEMNRTTPVWQLEQGWYSLEAGYRWIAPSASAHLWRPQAARRFRLRVNVGPELLEKAGPVTVSVWIADQKLDSRRFTERGWQEAVWEIAPAPAGPVAIRFQASPGYRPPEESRELGIAIGGFGFVPN
jgi:hypothetical protein